MRQGLGLRVGKTIGALAVVAGVAAGCADDGVEEAARQRLSSTGAAGGGDESAAGGAGGGAGTEDELEDVVVLAGPVAAVDVRDNTFNEENIQVLAGTRVVWTNNGRQDHDIVPVENGWGVDAADFTPDAVYEHVFDEPGTYRYYCSLHGTAEAGMTGAIVVAE